MPIRIRSLAAAAGLLFCLAACTGPEGAFCETAGECDDGFLAIDPVGSSDDSVGVCIVNQQTLISALRANSEEVCQDLADAYEAYWTCVPEEGCDSFELTEPECKDELEDIVDLQSDAGNRCNE